MKNIIRISYKLLISQLLFVTISHAQNQPVNLVPNPSFEQKSACAPINGQGFFSGYVSNWSSIGTTTTPDYFNSNCFSSGYIGVPSNSFGYQFPASGDAYGGIVASHNGNLEYISVELPQRLLAGKYYVEFKVSLSEQSKFATKDIGLALSVDRLYTDNNDFIPDIVPVVSSSNVITETQNWVKISGCFSTLGFEKFLTIGCFTTDLLETTQIANTSGIHEYAYYYIDDVVLIYQDNLPLDFSFNRFDNCQSSIVEFKSNQFCDDSYIWNFGDGTEINTNSNEPVNHVYTQPGYYNVTLGKAGLPLKQSVSKVVYILPSSSSYNPNCCIKNETYTNTDILLDNTNIQYVWSSDKRIKGEVLVKSGASLKINPNVNILFGPQGKIIVESGGELILDGCTLKSISIEACSGSELMWQGIEVWGNNTPNNNGSLVMKNNAKIESAYNAVFVGKPIFVVDKNVPNSFQSGVVDVNKSGGIIDISNSIFNRNANSIVIWNNPSKNTSKIINSTFKSLSGSNTKLNDPYIYNGFYYSVYANKKPLHMPNLYFDEPASMDRNGSLIHIRTFNRDNVSIDNNVFENASNAVFATNSKIKVANSSFYLNKKQINSTNTVGYLSTKNISNNNFYSNETITFNNRFHSTLLNENNLFISKNNFNSGVDIIFNDILYRSGISIYSYSYNSIIDNVFNNSPVAIFFDSGNEKNVGNIIGYSSSGNFFNNCKLPISLSGNNSTIKIKCNTFNNSMPLLYNSRNWEVKGLIGNQGKPDILGSTLSRKSPAGNVFPVINRNHIFADNKFIYYSHSDAFTHVSSYVNGKVYNKINPISFSSFSASCAPLVIPDDDEIDNINDINYLTSLKLQIQDSLEVIVADMLYSLENFPIEPMIDLIQNASDEEIFNNLEQYTLLPDIIIENLIDKDIPFENEELLLTILTPNLPVNKKLEQIFYDKFEAGTYSSEFIQAFESLQAFNPSFNSIEAYNKEIFSVNQELNELRANLFYAYEKQNYLNDEKEINAQISLLANDTSSVSKRILIGTLLQNEMPSDALDVLNSINLISNSDYDYNLLSLILIDLKLNGKSYWEMDSTQIADISYLASICPDNEASISAKCILNLVYLDSIKLCNGMSFNRPYNTIKMNNENAKTTINSYPNPFNNSTTIKISNKNNSNYKLIVRDLTMRILKEISIENDDEVTLTNEVFNNQGIYICSLKNLTNGEISTIKLVYYKR